MVGRTTLGSPDAPEIRVLLDGDTANFAGGAWTATVPQLTIFDSLFISENMYSGDAVELDHRRNLYGVIVGKPGRGKPGRDMAFKIDDLDAASRAKSTEILERGLRERAETAGLDSADSSQVWRLFRIAATISVTG